MKDNNEVRNYINNKVIIMKITKSNIMIYIV